MCFSALMSFYRVSKENQRVAEKKFQRNTLEEMKTKFAGTLKNMAKNIKTHLQRAVIAKKNGNEQESRSELRQKKVWEKFHKEYSDLQLQLLTIQLSTDTVDDTFSMFRMLKFTARGVDAAGREMEDYDNIMGKLHKRMEELTKMDFNLNPNAAVNSGSEQNAIDNEFDLLPTDIEIDDDTLVGSNDLDTTRTQNLHSASMTPSPSPSPSSSMVVHNRASTRRTTKPLRDDSTDSDGIDSLFNSIGMTIPQSDFNRSKSSVISAVTTTSLTVSSNNSDTELTPELSSRETDTLLSKTHKKSHKQTHHPGQKVALLS